MIYLVLITDVLLSCLLLWLILSASGFWRRVNAPYQYQGATNPELNRLLEVDPLDWNDVTLDGHEID